MAAVRSWKDEGDKDRRSRMAHSTINAAMKKGGAGVGNWGGRLDVTDYEPKGVNGSVGVITAPAPSVAAPVAMIPSEQSVVLSDAAQFPSLGVCPSSSANVVTWGPKPKPEPPTQAQIVLQQQQELQRASLQNFGPQHPRNQFARAPYVVQSAPVPDSGVPAIDWSAAGTTDLHRKVFQGMQPGAVPSHVSPYATVQPQPGATQVRAPAAPVLDQRMSKQQLMGPQVRQVSQRIQQPLGRR